MQPYIRNTVFQDISDKYYEYISIKNRFYQYQYDLHKLYGMISFNNLKYVIPYENVMDDLLEIDSVKINCKVSDCIIFIYAADIVDPEYASYEQKYKNQYQWDAIILDVQSGEFLSEWIAIKIGVDLLKSKQFSNVTFLLVA